MYIIIDKSSKQILSLNVEALQEDQDIRFLYPEFDPNIMDYGYGDFDVLPDNFDIIDNKIIPMTLEEALRIGEMALDEDEKLVDGRIVLKTIEEKISEGLMTLSPQEKLVDGKIVIKTLREQVDEGIIQINEPFEFINGNDELDYRTMGELLDNQLIKTEQQAQLALDILNDSLEKEILSQYSAGYESKLIKGYIDWMNEGKPTSDAREANYNKMQSDIDALKGKYKALKDKVKNLF